MIDDERTQPGEARDPTTGRDHDARDVDTGRSRVIATASTLGSDAGRPRAAVVPARVGRYIVLDGLGAGGMGVIHAAYDPELDRRVAIKLLRAGPGAESSGRLLREAQALARLSHPNVVQIHDTGVQDDQVFLAMELVDGVNLRGWLDAEPRPWRTILRMFVDAGRGLAAAHAAGIVHRDFKPENVLIGEDGRARVADFGLARQVADASATRDGAGAPTVPTSLAVSLTISGAILGTPAYMSPEQFAGVQADPRSDLFSFCVALHEALYGRRPFAGDDLPSLVGDMLAGRIQEPPAGSPVPRHVFALIRRGLAHAPQARPASMEALLAGLTYDPAARRRRWALAVGLAAAASGVTAALTLAAPRAAPVVCADEGGLFDLWRPEATAEVVAALGAVATPTDGDHVVAVVDRYVDEWRAAKLAACVEHRRGGESAAVFDARTRCLDRRRSALDGALRLLRAARPGDDVARVVAGLPAIDACARVDELLAAPPRDPALAAVVEPRIDEARALADAGRFDEAGAAIAIAVDAAQAAGDRVLLGQARLADGRREMMRGTWAAAAAALRLALADAVAGRDDATAAEAVARLLYARARSDEERPAMILADAPLARALVDRRGPDGFARRRLLADLGYVHLHAGDAASARAHLTAATDGLAAVVDADPLESANFLQSLATLTDDPVRRRDAYAAAEAILVLRLGEDHPEVLRTRLNRGRTAIDLDEANDQVSAACAGLRRRFPEPDPARDPSCHECGLLLGGLAEERGDVAAALRHYDDAAACDAGAPRTPDERANLGSQRDLARAHAAQLRDQAEPALAAAAQAVDALTPYARDEQWWLDARRADAWRIEGEVRLARGERPAARDALSRAHAALTPLVERLHDGLPRFHLARVAADLADLLWDDPSEHARARRLAAAAREFHASRGDAGAARVAALDTWLAAHP